MNKESLMKVVCNVGCICLDGVCCVLVVSILYMLVKFVGKSNKENIFYKEKYCFMFIFLICNMAFSACFIINEDIVKSYIEHYLSLIGCYIVVIFLLNLSTVLFMYRNIKDPSHLLIEVIKQPTHIIYEIFIIVLFAFTFGINWFLIQYKHINILKMFYSLICGIIILITFIYIILSKNMLTLYSFNFKDKFSSIINSNVFINTSYFILYICEFIFIHLVTKTNKINMNHSILLQLLIIVFHLIDCIAFLFQLYLSDSYYFLIAKSSQMKCLFCLYRKVYPDIHKMHLITNSDVDYKLNLSNSIMNSTLISNDDINANPHRKEIKYEQLGEFLHKNHYSINSYYIELLDFIINTSIITIAKLLDIKDDESDVDVFRFIKNEKQNDFITNSNLNSALELNGFKCEYDLIINRYFTYAINDIIKSRNINNGDIVNSLLSHYEKDENDSICQDRSLLIKNILEENFKKMKSLSLRTTDKRLDIEIISKHNRNKFDSFMNDYMNYVNEHHNTFLPTVMGVFEVKVNKFKELLFVITDNSLNQNTPINNLNTYYSTWNYGFPNKRNAMSKQKMKMIDNVSEWKNIIESDINFLCERNVRFFELESISYRKSSNVKNMDNNGEEDNDMKEKSFNFVKGNVYKVQIGNYVNNMHFQFKRVFDCDNFSSTTKCDCCYININEYQQYKRNIMKLFHLECIKT